MTAIGPTEVLIILVIAVLPIVIWIVGLVDALRRPDADWAATGQSKLTWVLVIALSQLAAVGFLLSIVYWVSARPALKLAARTSRRRVAS